jgi:uncharacterized protein
MSRIAETIRSQLDKIETDEEIIVLLAVESGSRAWGFESVDSDFDVRFVYVHRREWYLSIDVEERRDVFELPIQGEIDISGWDIRKALRLFRKSNPPLLEWLQCPLIYRERSSFAKRLRDFLPLFHSPRASFFHYLHMAKGNMREYLKGDTVWRKKYLYVLRPIMAMRWLERGLGPVPIEFGKLLATLSPGELRNAIDDLVAQKKNGEELDRGPKIPVINDWIDSEIVRLERIQTMQRAALPESNQLNDLFRSVLTEVWGD